MYILGFNGPPRSGKDTLSRCIADVLHRRGVASIHRPFSFPMRMRAFAALGMDYTDAQYEDLKDTPMRVLKGDTLRKFMIKDSEKFMKREYGPEIWWDLWRESIPRNYGGVVLAPDFGFQHESDLTAKWAGKCGFILIKTERRGCDFSNDSRDYVKAPLELYWHNNGTLSGARTVAEIMVEECISYGWRL